MKSFHICFNNQWKRSRPFDFKLRFILHMGNDLEVHVEVVGVMCYGGSKEVYGLSCVYWYIS